MNHIIPIRIPFGRLLTAAAVVFALQTQAQVLFQEGFNYTSGSNLGTHAPWGGGSSANIQIGSTSLTYPGLTSLGGNGLVVTSGAASSDTNVFTGTAVTSGTLYFSFLVDCTALTTANNYLISLNPAGTKPGGSGDAFSFYTGVNGSGWKIGVRTSGGGSGAVYEPTVLNLNQTYLIVGEYTFGASTTVSLFLDPTAVGTQPGTPDATQTSATPVSGGLANIGVKSQSGADGSYILDDFRIGLTWADVTPTPEPSTLALASLGALGLVARLRRRRS
ncbi:MAG TPA: PEP-CTERM sorting domain-containing protein [Verrucomicrobiae bacterium]|jgi:hypothetical protein